MDPIQDWPGNGLADDDERWLEPEDCTDEEILGEPMSGGERAWARRRAREARERWRRLPDDDLPGPVEISVHAVGTLLRAARASARVSQRELAVAVGVPRSKIGHLEAAEKSDPRLSTLLRLLAACDLRLAVVDAEGTLLATPYDREGFHDRSARHLPAHLDVYRPAITHRSRYGSPGFVGPARVAAGRPRPARTRQRDPD